MRKMLKRFCWLGFDSPFPQLYLCFMAIILNLLSSFVKKPTDLIDLRYPSRTSHLDSSHDFPKPKFIDFLVNIEYSIN